MRRRAIIVALLQLCIFFALEGATSQFVLHAAHIITIVVPTAVGSTSDYATRVFAQELERRLGERIVVINMPGVGGYEKVERAPPDGTTLTIYTKAFQKYEARNSIDIEQFAPVAVFARGRGLLAPKNTPRTVIDRLEEATQWVTKTASFKKNLKRRGLEAHFVDSQEFLSEVNTW